MRLIAEQKGGSAAVQAPAVWAWVFFALLLWPVRQAATPPEPSLKLAERWLAAIRSNDPQGAIEAARLLAPEPREVLSDPAFTRLARDSGVPLVVYSAPYNDDDYALWREALFFHTLATKITRGDRSDLASLHRAVVERMALPEGRRAKNPSPRDIWFGGAGSCDERSWVFAALAHQLGWNPEIVHLIHPETQGSPHTICTLSRPDHGVWFADPLCNVLIPRTVESAADDPELLQRIWPDRPLWHRSIRQPRFWIPALPQDYFPRNQRLYLRLLPLLKDRCPRFGEPPGLRLAEARDRHATDAHVELWYFPFAIYCTERNSTGRSKP